jgi:uncharacterized membrane protein
VKRGIVLLGVGSAAAGVLDLIYGAFEPAHQPIQAISDHIPGVRVLAYLVGIWLIAGGIAIMRPATARAGAIALAIVYACFAAFWIPRLWTVPRLYGHSWRLYIGLVTGPCVDLVPIVGALIVLGKTRGVRGVMAFATIMFGLEHLANPADVATLIPSWMPLGGETWSIVTGICFVAAGIAFAVGTLDVLAARLLAAMFTVFTLLSLIPLLIAAPREQTSWGGNFVNLAVIGATWLFAQVIQAAPSTSTRAPSGA